MLQKTYCLLAIVLLIPISRMTVSNHAAVKAQSGWQLLADGPDPQPGPIPLAQPRVLLADGPDPQPGPIPLAVPGRNLPALATAA